MGGKSKGGRFSQGQYIDPSRFINKSVITEQVEHFVPEHKFADFLIDERLKKNIIAKGYTMPTPIQDRAIPHILRGSDVVGIANTGTGKTAAFLIPLINKVLVARGGGANAPQTAGPAKLLEELILIIVPTRELAIQIDDELKAFVKGLGIFSACCVGGAAIRRQISDLRRGGNFLIGTPGRLKDLMQQGHIHLERFNTIVLDEADRMLDMGFINDVKFMMAKMSVKRHTLFFSATLSPEIERLIGAFLREPARISVKTQETAANVEQDIVRVPRQPREAREGSFYTSSYRGADGMGNAQSNSGQNMPVSMSQSRSGAESIHGSAPIGSGSTSAAIAQIPTKLDMLHDLLIKPDFSKVLIFGRTKHGVEKLSKALVARGFKAESIHGNKNHSKRQKALTMFKDGGIQVLVATDVAARGLDIVGVTHVINYDLPATYEDYIHRIGRTGRGNKKGKALTFVE
jgi:superfamily II DNA/RNA helicase